MILQVEGHTIWQLYVMGHRRLPFMVIHRGKMHWKRDCIVSIHRKGGVGLIDKVFMYHLLERGSEDRMFEIETIEDAVERSKLTNKLNYPTPVLCERFADPIWYRIGPGWRIVQTVDPEQKSDTLEG
jgi:hypothetical protein